MKRSSSLVAICWVASLGCTGQVSSAAGAAGDAQLGTLQLALSGADTQGRQYRLRAATFAISGTRYDTNQSVSTTVSSEDELEKPFLHTRLFNGYYTVSLEPDAWYIERITPDATERVEKAFLLSGQPQYAYIQPGALSQVSFQFGVDGELIDFIGGDLDIGITIQLAPDAGAGR